MEEITGRILLVDDDPSVHALLEQILKRDGHDLTSAEGGKEALDLLETADFDLILLDIIMPDMDGFSVMEAINKHKHLRPIPVVVISAMREFEAMIRCVELGAEDYLEKPFNRTLLRARINSSLQKKHLFDREKQYREELESLYEEAQAANQTKSDFVAIVAHELRTPLSTLWAYTDLLDRLGSYNERQQHCLDKMQFSLDRMNTIVADLDDISRIESGNLRLELEPVDVHHVIEMALETLRPGIEHCKQTLTLTLPDELPFVWADQARLIQIITNLISNASKYTPDEGTIAIHAAVPFHQPFNLQISVEDSGIGISSEDQKEIFSKFFRSGNPKARRVPGAGLGLHITRRLVEKQGGTIWFESEIDQGTTFHFTVPIAETHELDWSTDTMDKRTATAVSS